MKKATVSSPLEDTTEIRKIDGLALAGLPSDYQNMMAIDISVVAWGTSLYKGTCSLEIPQLRCWLAEPGTTTGKSKRPLEKPEYQSLLWMFH